MRYRLQPMHCRPWTLNGCFDAKYMKGGHSGWKAIGGRIRMRP